MNRFFSAIASIALASVGCDEKASETTSSASASSSTAPKPAATGSSSTVAPSGSPQSAKPAELRALSVPELGVKIDAPTNANTIVMPELGTTVYTLDGKFSVNVHAASTLDGATLEDAKKRIEREHRTFKKFTVEKTTPDGYHLEFEFTTEKPQPQFGVIIRKKVGDKQLICGGRPLDENMAKAAVDACATLAKI